MESAIQFQENQTKIYLGKHKLMKSKCGEEYIELHLVCPPDETSGYNTYNEKNKTVTHEKFVTVLTFENKHSIEELKLEIENEFTKLKYFESGGYIYVKKLF